MKYLRTYENYQDFLKKELALVQAQNTIKKKREDLGKSLIKAITDKFDSIGLNELKIQIFSAFYKLSYFKIVNVDNSMDKDLMVDDNYSVNHISEYRFEYLVKILKALEELTPKEIEEQRIEQESEKFNI